MAVQAYVVFCRISKLFISAIVGCYKLWLGNTVLMLHTFTRPTPSRPEPPIHHSPLFSNLDSAHYAAIAVWRPDTRAGHLQGYFLHTPTAVWHWPRFSPLRVYVYHCVLTRLFCRHCRSVITPIVARSLPLYLPHTCLYTFFKLVNYIQRLTIFTLLLLYGKSNLPRCNCNRPQWSVNHYIFLKSQSVSCDQCTCTPR